MLNDVILMRILTGYVSIEAQNKYETFSRCSIGLIQFGDCQIDDREEIF